MKHWFPPASRCLNMPRAAARAGKDPRLHGVLIFRVTGDQVGGGAVRVHVRIVPGGPDRHDWCRLPSAASDVSDVKREQDAADHSDRKTRKDAAAHDLAVPDHE